MLKTEICKIKITERKKLQIIISYRLFLVPIAFFNFIATEINNIHPE